MRTTLHTPTLGNHEVILKQPTARHLKTVIRQFVALFHVQPVVTVAGYFPVTAFKEERYAFNVMHVSGEVGLVGNIWIEVCHTNGKAYGSVRPELGESIFFYLTVPKK